MCFRTGASQSIHNMRIKEFLSGVGGGGRSPQTINRGISEGVYHFPGVYLFPGGGGGSECIYNL